MTAEVLAPQSESPTEMQADPAPLEELLTADLLVEDVSIDGMCGVY